MSNIVLCAVDISQPEHERPVLKRAMQIAKLDGARLDVITVVPDFGSMMVGSYFDEDFHNKAVEDTHAALTSFVEEMLGDGMVDNLRHIVATGVVHEQVLRAAEAEKARVIVLGSHRPALRDYLLGPNAAHVVRHSNCSVFVVREK